MPTGETQPATARPFVTFNFRVRIELSGESKELCEGAFAECDGLEMTMEPKTFREGGNNTTQYQVTGPMSYGQLTLKRGMTPAYDLWEWFARANTSDDYSLRATTHVDVLPSDRSAASGDATEPDPLVTFILYDCLPIKLKAPALSANGGGVAIEELQVAYERMKVQPAS